MFQLRFSSDFYGQELLQMIAEMYVFVGRADKEKVWCVMMTGMSFSWSSRLEIERRWKIWQDNLPVMLPCSWTIACSAMLRYIISKMVRTNRTKRNQKDVFGVTPLMPLPCHAGTLAKHGPFESCLFAITISCFRQKHDRRSTPYRCMKERSISK